MSDQSTHRPNKNKGKIAERIAFDPFLPQQDLINEFIRNTINPNTDLGIRYFVGKILDIIKNDDSIIDNRDIFYSQSDNYERVVKAVNNKKYNEGRKVCIVHVPSFITGTKYQPRNNNLNYDVFTKLRIEYRGKEEIKVGDIVKIQFGNEEKYTDPEIIAIQPSEPSYLELLTNISAEAHKKYEDCKVLNLKFPTEIGTSNINVNVKPPGGYKQALLEIQSIFSDSYIKAFINTIKVTTAQETEFGRIQNIILKPVPNSIVVDSSVYTTYSNLNLSFLGSTNDPQNKYLIKGTKDILISCEQPEKNNNLKNKFYNYIKTDLNSRLNYLFSFNDNDNSFIIDMNLNLLELKGQEGKTVENYLKISKVFDELNFFPYSATTNKTTQEEIQKQNIKPKDVVDSCEAELAKDKTIYPIIYDGKNFTNKKIQTDNKIIESYNSLDIEQIQNLNNFVNAYININYFYKLLGQTGQTIQKYLKTKNSNFYKDGPGVIDDYKEGTKNVFGLDSLSPNLNKISSFLNFLKKQIEKLEQYGENSGRVLIVPFQVLKIKPTSPTKGNDKNSRHFYAKAIDIRVYIKEQDPKNPKKTLIKQIGPEIISLYVDLVRKSLNLKIGQGLFLQEDKRYNHIEFLESNPTSMGLTQEEYDQRILYINDKSSDPLEKLLKENPGADRIYILKNQIRQNPTYISNAGVLDPRFDLLTLPGE